MTGPTPINQLIGPNGKPLGMKPNDLWLVAPDDILTPLGAIRKFKYGTTTLPSVAELEKMSGYLRDQLVSGNIDSKRAKWSLFFMAIGKMTLDVLGSKFVEDEFVKVLLGKHKRYGTRSLTGWRELGIHSRIDQKIARAMNMIENPKLAEDDQGETMHDTLIDVVGYCIIGLYMVEYSRLSGDKRQ